MGDFAYYMNITDCSTCATPYMTNASCFVENRMLMEAAIFYGSKGNRELELDLAEGVVCSWCGADVLA